MTETIISNELLAHYLRVGTYTRREMQKISRDADAVYGELTEGKKPRSLGQQGELLSFVGPPGAGKTTLLREMVAAGTRPHHTVVIDPDLVREKLPFFQNAYRKGLQQGLDAGDADYQAILQWNAAAIWATQSMVNRAQADGYNLARAGTIGGPVTRDVCFRAESAGYQLTTIVVVAPEEVCRESIAQRLRKGGHPVSDDYLTRSLQAIAPSLPLLQDRSDRLQFFWRGALTASPVLVAEIGVDRRLIIHDPSGFEELNNLAGLNPETFITSSLRRPQPQISSEKKTFG